MPHPLVQTLLSEIQQLNLSQQAELYQSLVPWLTQMETWSQQPATIQQVREARFAEGLQCPRCNSGEVKRNGKFKDKRGIVKQRYLCKGCGRTFTDLTKTPIAYSKKQPLWGKMARCMIEGMSVRKTAAKLGISVPTAFFWRHKMLAALRSLDKPTLAGVVEADETYFRYFLKGTRRLRELAGRDPRKRGEPATKRGLSREQVCVIVARDRHTLTVAEVGGRGVPNVQILKRVLEPVMNRESILCTDGASSYKRFCVDIGVAHYSVNSKRANGSIYHINNVNNWHGRLKDWMVRFKGVATKYLNNYLMWFTFLEKTSKLSPVLASKQMLTDACSVLKSELLPLAQPLMVA